MGYWCCAWGEGDLGELGEVNGLAVETVVGSTCISADERSSPGSGVFLSRAVSMEAADPYRTGRGADLGIIVNSVLTCAV